MAKSQRPKMKSQFDDQQRVVSLENLYAMCARQSGMARRFTVEKVTKSRIHVSYSNPDEYGHAHPVYAVFPCYPSTFGGDDNPSVVLDMLRTYASDDYGRKFADEIWSCFDPIVHAPRLWRNPTTKTWQTEAEAKAWREAKDLEEAEETVPDCVASMGCLCAGHARGNLATDECDTSE